MKKAYLDASAFFKIFFGEAGAEYMEQVLELAKQKKLILVISDWVENECMWAAMKKHDDEKITKQDAFMIINLMADTVENGLENGYINSYTANEKVIVASRVLIEEGVMHASDALHVTIAVTSGCDYFITADKDITARIRELKLSIKTVYIHEKQEIDKFLGDFR